MSFQSDPSKVFGRDKVIARIWSILNKGKSIQFTAERRIGKTSVMQKMRAEHKDNFIPVLIDLERVHSPARFVEVLAQECYTQQSIAHKLTNFVKKYVGESIEVQGFKLTLASTEGWRTTLDGLFEDLCKKADDKIILFLLDEIPYMLQNIYMGDLKDGENNALEILDILRAMRGKYSNLRMIYTGSVGLHHVLEALNSRSPISQPLNDLELVSIESLQPNDALTCLNYFCESLQTKPDLIQKSRIAFRCNGVPFYMDKVINKLDLLEGRTAFSDQDVEDVFDYLLSSDFNEWQMGHFVERLKSYYIGDFQDASGHLQPRARLANLVLNELAQSTNALGLEEIYTRITAIIPLNDKSIIQTLLGDLVKDHYIINKPNPQKHKTYCFTYSLIQIWWCIHHNLTIPQGLI